jgi:hypothetical protein
MLAAAYSVLAAEHNYPVENCQIMSTNETKAMDCLIKYVGCLRSRCFGYYEVRIDTCTIPDGVWSKRQGKLAPREPNSLQ